MFSRAPGEMDSTVGAMNTAPDKPRGNLLSGADWLRHSFSVWRGLGKNGEERAMRHPAMFTVGLVSRLLDVYTCGKGVLLDPFAGAGTALLAALNKNMKAVGFDLNPDFRDSFVRRILPLAENGDWQYHVRDARELSGVTPPQSVDICITSPPYWDILNRRRSADGKKPRAYSNSRSDLGNIVDYDEFLNALGEVMAEVRKALKPGCPFVLNVMDLRKKSKFYPLHIDAAAEAGRRGFTLDDLIIWDRQDEYNNMRPLGYPSKFIINKVHEYLLVLR